MTTTEKRTIRLSDSAPVKISTTEWEVVATSEDHDNQHRSQANTLWTIEVLEHRDGRRIVAGQAVAGPGGKPITWRNQYAGWLVPAVTDPTRMRQPADGGPLTSMHPDDAGTIRAIRRVGGVIGREDLATECIGSLPATEI
jgi:hypothetical protein